MEHIKIQTTVSLQEVDGETVCPGLAVTKDFMSERRWCVTHIPSGFMLGPSLSKKKAMALAQELAGLGDWTPHYKSVNDMYLGGIDKEKALAIIEKYAET